LDNSESSTLSKVPGLGNIPILGALFKSKSFEKRETELVFFCTANIIKPVNRDDLPATRGLDGLKKGSPLGLEPQGEGIKGASGYSTGGEGAKVPATTDGKATNASDAKATNANGVSATSASASTTSANASTTSANASATSASVSSGNATADAPASDGATRTAAPATPAVAAPAKDGAREEKDGLKESAKAASKERAANTSPELPSAGSAARLALSSYIEQLPGAPFASVKVAAKQ
jgi:hypothetical protein